MLDAFAEIETPLYKALDILIARDHICLDLTIQMGMIYKRWECRSVNIISIYTWQLRQTHFREIFQELRKTHFQK